MKMYRSFLVWGIAILVVLGAFLLFTATGWPGEPASCILDEPDTCYCEAFNLDDVLNGAPGVRQTVNTWFNLYAIGTSLLVAFVVFQDRKSLAGATPRNQLRSTSFIPELYIFAVLFLGLGSMFFHGSLREWGGNFDGFSMYVFASFLAFYSIRRFWHVDWFFWVGYLTTVIIFSILHALAVLPSFILIAILVLLYLVVEVYIGFRSGTVLQGNVKTQLLWIFALSSMGLATFFWWASHTGNFLCDPQSLFQPHGLLWHPLAGVMAVLLYFYWREADDSVL